LFACQGLVCKTCSVIGRRKRCQKCMRILTCSLKLVIRPAKWNAHYRGVPASSKVDKLPFLFEPDHRCKLMAATSGKPTSEPMASEASSVLGSRAHARPAFVLWVNGLTIVYTACMTWRAYHPGLSDSSSGRTEQTSCSLCSRRIGEAQLRRGRSASFPGAGVFMQESRCRPDERIRD
jgi:hypothetical protein